MNLKNRLTMQGIIDQCWLFTYSVPAIQVRSLLPDPLTLVTRGDTAFFNIVVCHLRRMRPLGLPGALGISYWHVAYRLYVKAGEEEGLHFLRSDADSRLIATVGNILSDFKFHHAGISVAPGKIHVSATDAAAEILLPGSPPGLPDGSLFTSIEDAEAFLKYKPAAFSVRDGGASVMRITRDELAWKSQLVSFEAQFEFLEPFSAKPEICYELAPIEYIWNRAVPL